MAIAPQITIPRPFHSGFATLMSMSDKEMQQLIHALRETSPTQNPERFASLAAARAGADATEIDSIFQVILSLYTLRAQLDLPLNDAINVICKALERTGIGELQPKDGNKDGNWDPFRERLRNLLSLDRTVGVVAKAQSIWTQQPSIFRDAHILTDVRPVFTEHPEEGPIAALLVHQLHVTYEQDRDEKHFFVALDSEDLRMLRAVLDRAEAKGKSIEPVLESTAMSILENKS